MRARLRVSSYKDNLLSSRFRREPKKLEWVVVNYKGSCTTSGLGKSNGTFTSDANEDKILILEWERGSMMQVKEKN